MNVQFIEETKKHIPFSLLVTIKPKEDIHIGILFNNKPTNNKIEKEFSKNSNIKILVTSNVNYNGLNITICTDDKTIDNYTIPNKKWNYIYTITYGNKCITKNSLEFSRSGYLLTDLLLDMIMNKQYISNIDVTIPDKHLLCFKSNDDMIYHYHNLAINTVCKTKKIIELAYTLNHNVKNIRVYTSDHCLILNRNNKITEYTIGKDKYYMLKSNEHSKDLMFINGNQKVNVDILFKRLNKSTEPQIVKSGIELYKIIYGNI